VRILVVEDGTRLAGLLCDGLTAEGFAVDVACDGGEALRMAAEQGYGAIVLDVALPALDGYEVCARLRARGVWAPILMLTPADGAYDEAKALDTGADDFLTRPFSPVVLLARLRALVRRETRERPTALAVGDLRIDPAGLRCSRDGVAIALTPKEFAVLHCLARRAGEVVPKSELLARAWDAARDGASNVVEVHISALRRKIDRPFGRSTISTVRGAGYRLES
jgi:DNA-binding response OmpR family regulator